MAAQTTAYMLSIDGATWIDVNSQFTVDSNPDRLPDVLAVSNSIYNLLNSPLGSRSRIWSKPVSVFAGTLGPVYGEQNSYRLHSGAGAMGTPYHVGHGELLCDGELQHLWL
jgi:hypothetical protein